MARIRVQYLPGTANSADAKAARLINYVICQENEEIKNFHIFGSSGK
jgi:hypothetical protein